MGGALTMRRTGAGDVFLGNVFDPSATNIDINAVDISARHAALQGGNIWGDDGITLHLERRHGNGWRDSRGPYAAPRPAAATSSSTPVRSSTSTDPCTLAGKADIESSTSFSISPAAP